MKGVDFKKKLIVIMCDAGEDDVEATAIIAIVAKVDSSKMNRYLQDQ